MADKMKRIVLASRPKAVPTIENFRLETMDIPVPRPGQFLARTIWLSLDPYMRGRMNDAKSYAAPVEVGATMEGGCVAQVVRSDHPGFDAGDIVVGSFGWASHGISDGTGMRKVDPSIAPVSTAVGVLGMPGLTAWVGLNDIAQAKAGETIVVSAATGAVGSMVGQLAKRKGLRVIGVAGSADKCRYAVSELGYDICLDHRAYSAARLSAKIAEAAPKGVDVYYENVGGKTVEAVLPNMNTFGRIALCGMIAWYSGENIDKAMSMPAAWGAILRQRLAVRGFIIFDHYNRLPDFLAEVAPLISNGEIAYRETVAETLENAPSAFLELLKGNNFGKQLVRVGDYSG